MKNCLLILLLATAVFIIKPMEIPSYFKLLPLEMKVEIASKLLDQKDIEDVIHSLNALALTDKEFFDVVMNQEPMKTFFIRVNELNKLKVNELKRAEILKQLWSYFDKYPRMQQYDLAEYLHKRFPNLPAGIFQDSLFGNKLRKTGNPVEALRLIYDNLNLQFVRKKLPDLLISLQKKFPYLGAETLKNGLDFFDPDNANDLIKTKGAEFAKMVLLADLPGVFNLLIAGVDPNTKISDESGEMVTPLQLAIRNKYTSLIKLLRDVGAKQNI